MTANACHCTRSFRDFCRCVVRAAGAEPRRALCRCTQGEGLQGFFFGVQHGQVGVDAGGGVGIKALLARYAFHGGGGQNIEAIIQAFKMGEQSARKALDEWAWWLGRGLAVLTSVLDPEKIVIGGALAELYPHVEQETIRSLRQHLLPGHPLPPILVSGLRENAAAIGGAAMLHHDFLSINQSVVFEGLDHSPSRMRTVA